MLLYRLPAYSPHLNPQEHLWDKLREKEFPNRVVESMEGVRSKLNEGLPRLAGNQAKIESICAWPRIKILNLNATQNKRNYDGLCVVIVVSVDEFRGRMFEMAEEAGRMF